MQAEGTSATQGVTEDVALEIGQRILRLRKERRVSLQELGALAKVSSSTISLIENGKLSPSYSVLSRIFEALGLHFSETLSAHGAGQVRQVLAPGCRAVDRAGKGARHTTPMGMYEFLGTELATKRMEAAIIQAAKDGPARKLEAHSGEELIHVQDGEVILYMEHYAPLPLRKGDSVYFDASTPHGVYAATAGTYLSITAR